MIRRRIATSIAAAILLAGGCRSPREQAEESRARAASWAATSEEVATAFGARMASRPFAQDALRTAADALAEEAENLGKLAPSSPRAAEAVGAATRARDEARALLRLDAADLAARVERLREAEKALRNGRPS